MLVLFLWNPNWYTYQISDNRTFNTFIEGIYVSDIVLGGILRWFGGKGFACQSGRPRFDLWVVEDLLEKEMPTYSSTLAWEIPWTEEPGGLQPMVSQELDVTQRLKNNNSSRWRWYNNRTDKSLYVHRAHTLIVLRWEVKFLGKVTMWFITQSRTL